ncbi:MAG: TonB-dependent receptor domain-containing protein [Marinifilaceae bacterium]
MTKQVILALLLIASALSSFSQTGSLKGNVKDAKTGETLIGASVYLDGTTLGTTTDFDGNYQLDNIPVGTYTLKCSFISYEIAIQENVVVKEGNTQNFDFSLGTSAVALNDVRVVAKLKRESEVALLVEQKKSAVIKQTIGAQQLATQGVSDAASAATKITGVAKQEGTKGLNIRGLGDRYNTTTLNGLPLPSNNAETKNIDLELFSTDVIEYVGVEKVFTPNLYGDFAGANIDIISKKHSGDPFLKIGVKTGYNTSTADADDFFLQDGPGFTGFDNFDQPTSLNSYDFENGWNPQKKTVLPNLGFSLSGGKTFELNEAKLNAFFTLSYENEYRYSELLQRRVNGSDNVRKDLEGEKFNFETQTTGMFNLNYSKGNTNFYFNSLLMNTSDQELKNLRGTIIDLAEDGGYVRRSEYERTTALVNQLLGDHKVNDKLNLNWGIAYNKVQNIVPDRMHFTLDGVNNGTGYFTDLDPSNHFRYFHELDENEIAGNISLAYKLGEGLEDANYRGKLTVGYSGKHKTNSFESTQFNHDIYRGRNFFDPDYFVHVDVNDLDAFHNQQNINKEFYLVTFFGNSIRSSTFDGTQDIHTGFVSLEYNISPKLVALAGVRFEDVTQDIEYVTALQPEGGSNGFTEFKVLPSLSLKYALNEKNNIRFASGITYTLPQFKEKAKFAFEGITETTVGNPYLTPSTNYNAELKWEFFPKSSELVSVAAFGKYIQDPINKFVMASASNDFTYANTGDWAYLYGAEFEVKKTLAQLNSSNGSQKLFATANLTLMHTNQELDADKVFEETEGTVTTNFNQEEEELQGAAPLIANASLSYKINWRENKNSITSSLVYGYTSDQLYLIGFSSLGNQVNKEIHNLDFVIKSQFDKLEISLSAKNLLNQDVERRQENEARDWVVQSYQKGIKFSLGLNYKF